MSLPEDTRDVVPVVESDPDAPERSIPREPPFGGALGVIAAVGLAARVLYVVLLRHHPIYVDSLGYHFRAQLLADGHGFVLPAAQILHVPIEPPDAHVPPAWPLLLALPTRLGMRSVFLQQLFACVVGSATIVMAGLAGRAAFGRRAGLIAAALVAVYPNVWLYERELMSETLAMLGAATCLWLAFRFHARPSVRLAVALGAAVAVLALTRSEQIAIFPIVVVPLILTARRIEWRRRVVWLALAGTACALVIAPWFAYNLGRFEHPVLISTGLGGAMRAGNCKATYYGPLLGFYHTDYRVGDPNACSILDKKFASDETVTDGQLRHAAITFMRQHLSRVPIVVAARIGRTFNVFRPLQQVHLEGERKTPLWVLRLALFSYWLLAPLAIVGAVLARRRRIPIYPLVAFPVVVVLAVTLTLGSVRYRAPAEIAMALLAAFAIDRLTDRRRANAPVGRAS